MEKVICNANSVRIDAYLAEYAGKTRSFMQKAIAEGLVKINGNHTKAGTKVKEGDIIEYEFPQITVLSAKAQSIPLDIAYEDEHLLVVNKPAGMVVHPAPGNPENTLVNAVMAHCEGNLSGINSVLRPGIVHRIDKDTSGLLVIAKNDDAHNGLAAQLKVHSMTRVYTCIVRGHFDKPKGTVNAPIGRNKNDRKKMAVTPYNSKNAVTHFEVIEELSGYSLVKCRLETGRTHQIRVHMSHIGHPILGDTVYGGKNNMGVEGQLLHAGVLGFVHPITEEYMEFSSPLPEHFVKILNKLKIEE